MKVNEDLALVSHHGKGELVADALPPASRTKRTTFKNSMQVLLAAHYDLEPTTVTVKLRLVLLDNNLDVRHFVHVASPTRVYEVDSRFR